MLPLRRCGRGFRAGLLIFSLLLESMAAGQQRSFVSCPIVRDTKTVPCYLAEYDGETYYLGSQQDAAAGIPLPQLKHEVLVEGRVATGAGTRVCGGIPLDPVSFSVFKEVNLACSTMLPPEPGIEAPATVRTAPKQTGPEFTIGFMFDDDSVAGENLQAVMDAADYALRTGASQVKVTGYRATSLLSNSQRLVEKTGIAQRRAEAVVTLLRGLGVKGVSAEWKDEAEPGDGSGDAARRRVAISITN